MEQKYQAADLKIYQYNLYTVNLKNLMQFYDHREEY